MLAPGLLDGHVVLLAGGGMTKYPRSVVEEAASTVPLQRPGRHEERART